jgi:protein-L-isoaspartate(D-aspartate) O-methyltransferase
VLKFLVENIWLDKYNARIPVTDQHGITAFKTEPDWEIINGWLSCTLDVMTQVGQDGADGYAHEAGVRGLVEEYVQALKAAGAIRSASVERAFRTVQRHRLMETFFCRGEQGRVTVRHDPARPRRADLEVIYADTALATRYTDGAPTSSSSAPSLVAEMLELLELREGMKVLEIGAGTGYNAALVAEIVGDQRLVVTVDNQQDVVEQTRRLLAETGYLRIRVLARDGFQGIPEEGPFDRIVATVGCSDLSPRWAEQLADGGLMLVPLEHAQSHPLTAVRKQDGELRGRFVGWTGFMPVRGPLQIEDMWSRGVVIPETRENDETDDVGEIMHEPGPRLAAHDDSCEQNGFMFFVALNDRRASWTPDGTVRSWTPEGVGLSAGPDGWAGISTSGLWWWKDESLAREVDRLYRDWTARGRPTIRDYRVTFLPVKDERNTPPGGWQIERRFYREIVTAD